MDGKITFDFSDKLYSVWSRRAGTRFGRADRSTMGVAGISGRTKRSSSN